MIPRYLVLISLLALSLCGVAGHVFADTVPSQYVGKHLAYDLESYVYVKNELVYELSGQIKYEIISFDSKSGEFTLKKSVDLKSQDGTKFTAAQDFRSRLDHPLSLFDVVSYVDPIFPGTTEFTLKKTKESAVYDIGIIRRDLLEQQTVLNESIEPTLVYTLNGKVKTLDQTTIPSSITLDLKSVSLEGVKDKTIRDAVLEDYGSRYDYYKNMKFSLKITASDSKAKKDSQSTPKTSAPKQLLYENKKYGFSIKYPQTWEKKDLIQQSPNSDIVSIVSFTLSQDTAYGIGFSVNNQDYKGLGEKQLLAKMKQQISDACSAGAANGVSCSEITVSSDTHKNGYKMFSAYYAATVPTEQGTAVVIEITTYIPDGNDIWILQVFSTSPDDLEKLGQDLGASFDTFKIYDYQGVKSSKTISKQTTKTVKTPPPVAKSDAGTLQLNSGEFSASKYSKAEVIVSGQVSNYQQGVLLTLTITKPDGTSEVQNAMVTKDGDFKTPLKINGDWPAGTYTISAKYGSQDIGSISFQLNLEKTK